jgi:hypothetical protein
MQIDYQAPFATRREILIKAPLKKVWNLEADINHWSQWQVHITKSSLDTPLKKGAVFHWKARGLNITSTLQVVQYGKCIGWTGQSFGTQAYHIFTFKERKNSTLVIAEESLNGWLPKLMKLFIPGYLEESMESSLRMLKNKAEEKGNRKKTNQ